MRVALGGKGCFANPPRTFFTGKGFRFTLSRADVKRPGRKPFLRGPSTAESVLCHDDDGDCDRRRVTGDGTMLTTTYCVEWFDPEDNKWIPMSCWGTPDEALTYARPMKGSWRIVKHLR
jgi:hypothetical protein